MKNWEAFNTYNWIEIVWNAIGSEENNISSVDNGHCHCEVV